MERYTIAILIGLMQLLLIIAKIVGILQLRWLWVLSPTWIVVIAIGFIVSFVGCVIADVDKKG